MTLETQQWLVWLGIKSPQRGSNPIAPDVQLLKEHVGDYSAFQTLVDDATSFTSYQSALESAGFSTENAGNHVKRVQKVFTDWAAYATFVVDETDSYPEYKARFGSLPGVRGGGRTAAGQSVAGIRIHESEGVSYDGVDVPAGTIEVYGRRVEFSEQAASIENPKLAYANIQVSDTEPSVGDTITVSADVTNEGARSGEVSIPLLSDGGVRKTKTVFITSGATKTVSFEVSESSFQSAQYGIGSAGPVQVNWLPSLFEV